MRRGPYSSPRAARRGPGERSCPPDERSSPTGERRILAVEERELDVIVGVVAGLLLAGSARAGWRFARAPRRVLSPAGSATRAAVHAATVMLPDLRRGLSE